MKPIEHLAGLVFSKFAVARDVLGLIKLEARLAGASLIPLLILLCIFLVFFMSFWLILIGLIGYLFMHLLGDTLPALGVMFLINFFLLCIIFKSLKTRVQRMSFVKTREVLTNNQAMVSHENYEKITSRNREKGRKNSPGSRRRKEA